MVSFEYYRFFYFVAQYKSFTKAAEILNNNQPNITRCMNILENELECKLFVRSNRGVTLTPEGEKLFQHVAIAYEQLSTAESELKKDKSLESGLITIGASETALRLLLLDRLETFHAQYPGVRLKISNFSTPQSIQALENRLADISVVTTPLKLKKSMRHYTLASFREILLAGPKYADFSSKIHHLSELTDIPFISLGQNTGTREMHINYFLQHDLPFYPDIEAATADQILPMIRHNLGIGFYPEALAKEAIKKGEVVQLHLTSRMPEREICLIWDKNRPKSIAVRKLMDALQTANM